MSAPHISDFGKMFTARACGSSSATAAGSGDATAVTGATIDTRGFGSAKLVIAYKTSLTADKTLSYAVEYQESEDDSSWDTAIPIQAATVAETGELTDEVGSVEFDLDLGGSAGGTASATKTLGKRYIRFNFTPDLSHSGTDTALSSAIALLGGAEIRPAAYPGV